MFHSELNMHGDVDILLQAFAAAGPGLRNCLPSHLKEVDLSYNNRFWRSLKTVLFG